MSKTAPRPQILIRLDPDQMEALKQRAISDDRTPTNLARKTLVETLRLPTKHAA